MDCEIGRKFQSEQVIEELCKNKNKRSTSNCILTKFDLLKR